ncbi:hypothetical protein BC332_33324 [Capsicum chinense]|nr:hypothetical protein BC332_33324 [Capsicum chinense]
MKTNKIQVKRFHSCFYVEVYEVAASDHNGNIPFHKLVGRLDNSAVSAAGAKLAFKSNEEIGVQIKIIPLDEVIQETEYVLVIKIDVEGWEYYVLKGESKILSRKKGRRVTGVSEPNEAKISQARKRQGDMQYAGMKAQFDALVASR